jgi:extracellular elastinolytic metalloproteinase
VPAIRVACLAALALFALVAGSAARGAVDIPELSSGGLPDLDMRRSVVAPTAGQVAAADALGADVSWNRFGTPSSVFDVDGTLASGLQAADAVAAARAWLDQNKALFRLGSAEGLELVRDTTLVGNVGHAVLLGQVFDGVLAAPDGLVTVGITGSAANGWNVNYASSSLAASDAVATDAALSPEQAWVQAAKSVGETGVSTSDVTVTGTSESGWTELKVDGFEDTQSVRESAFPIPGQAARASYQAVVASADDVGYTATIDAATGQVLARLNNVDNAADNPVWKAFSAFPPTSFDQGFPWSRPDTDTRATWCWTPFTGCDLAVGNENAAGGRMVPWDTTDPAGAPTFTTRGHGANSRELWITSGGGQTLFQPTSATRDYVYPWTNAWFRSGCNPAELGTAAAPRTGVGADISNAVANLFVQHSALHDFAYQLGFTEATWNAQSNNFGVTTGPLPGRPILGNDPVTGNAQAGGINGGFPGFNGRDNANMNTQADGTPSVTNMFLWQPIAGSFYAPCVDGDYDMSVIGHEYGHMIENRMIGKGFRRAGNHAGAMGEAFGDLNAMEYMNEFHYVPVDGLSKFLTGAYVTGNPITGIRDYNMAWDISGDFPTPGHNARVTSLNLGDYAFDFVGQEVHADGEIWSAAQYTLRTLLLNRYPAHGAALDISCARGERSVDQCPGDRRWFQLYYDAMLLMPTGPTFLNARDAMLAADQMRFGGANQDLLWRGYAERGMGQFASSPSPADNDPVPDFSSPLGQNGTITFQAVSKDTGAAIPAKIYVGDWEARVTRIADTDPATVPAGPNSNLDDNAPFIATAGDLGKGGPTEKTGDSNGAGYNFIANAPGYGHVRFRVRDLGVGENRVVRIEFPTNFASVTQGATAAAGPGTQQNPQNLIDDTEGTNWGATAADVGGRYVTFNLGGRKSIQEVNVSAMLVPGQNRFTALRSFRMFACDTTRARRNTTCDPAVDMDWDLLMASGPKAFPSVSPRPLAPDLQIRNWDVRGTFATHVKFVVDTNQCSGQPFFQGEQDNDPQFTTDCRVTSLNTNGTVALPERDTEVHAAEVELLSDAPRVTGADTRVDVGSN